MTVLVALQLLFSAFLAFSFVTGLVASASVPLVRRHTAGWSPEGRHRALLLLAVSPALLGISAALATFTPSFLAFLWPEYDHCLVHPGHVHLCFVHPPAGVANPLVWGPLALAVAFVFARIGNTVFALRRACGLASGLIAHASREHGTDARLLPTARPLCLTFGVFRPVIVLSKGLVGSVSTQELEAILQHEQAHARRRDTLMRLVVEFATVFMVWSSKREELLRALDLAAEQSSDEAAAFAIGDRLTMAEVILKVERLLQEGPSELRTFAASIGGAGVPERVSALLEPRRGASGMRLVSSLLFGVVIALIAAGDPFHHALETLLGVLTN